jgi:hypothetical protein
MKSQTGRGSFSETADCEDVSDWGQSSRSVTYRADSEGLDLDSTERDLVRFAAEHDIDLDQLFEAASVHFDGDVIVPSPSRPTDSELDVLVEDELRAPPD